MYNLKLSVSISAFQSLGFVDGTFKYVIRQNFEDDIIKLKNLGFDCVELGMETYDAKDMYRIIKAIKICNKHKIKANSIHMPMCPEWVDFAYPWERDRKQFALYFNKLLKKLDKYKITSYVFHPGGARCKTEEEVEKYLDYLADSFNIISDGVKGQVCIENMNNTLPILDCSDKVVKLIRKCKNLKTCVDVNHFLKGEKAEDAILKYGDMVGTVHISDYDFINERHLMPLDGKIDFMKVINSLEKIGYKNAFTYEVSIGKRYGYTYEDVKANFDKLFSEYNKK